MVLSVSATRSPDIPYRDPHDRRRRQRDGRVADVNRDGRPDIVSGEYWYEAPAWTQHRFRELNFTSNYIDNFSDLPIDVDGDGYPDSSR